MTKDLIQAGSFWLNVSRIIHIQELDNGAAYVCLAGSDDILCLLPDEWQELKAAIEAGQGGDDENK